MSVETLVVFPYFSLYVHKRNNPKTTGLAIRLRHHLDAVV
jgi:hypothetical protein